MTGIDKICERISAQAEDAYREVLSRAESEVQEIRANCDKAANEASNAILARGKTQALEREARLACVAELEAKKLHLKTKQSMIDGAFEEALALLCAMDEERRVKLLSSLAAKAAVSGSERVICTASDHAAIGAKVVEAANAQLGNRGNLTLAKETTDAKGGLVLAEGTMEINCTFEIMLHQMHDEVSGEVAEILFQ